MTKFYCSLFFLLLIFISSAKTLDQLFPTVFNFNQECDLVKAILKSIWGNRPDLHHTHKLACTQQSVWHALNNTDVDDFFEAYDGSKSLFESAIQCSTEKLCTAFMKNGTRTFLFYSDTSDTYKLKPMPGAVSFVWKCCKPRIKKLSVNKRYNLPIVLNRNENCQTQRKCPFHSWHLQQNKILTSSSYRKLINKDTIDCLNECLNHPKCKFTAVEEKIDSNNLLRVCHLYKSDDDAHNVNGNQQQNKKKLTVYEKVCCKAKSTTNDFLLLYQPLKICESVTLADVKSCPIKIWHVEDRVRLFGNEKFINLDIQNCLKNCAEDAKCIGVTYDIDSAACFLFFDNNDHQKQYLWAGWVTYTLQCCNKIRPDDQLLSKNITNDKEYPIVFNMEESCFPQKSSQDSVLTCTNKVWLFHDNTQLGKTIKEKSLEKQYCFEFCYETKECIAISWKKEEQLCQLHGTDFGEIRTNQTNWQTYILKCCKLKDKNKDKRFNFPIVVTDQKKHCVTKHPLSTKAWLLMPNKTIASNTPMKSFRNINTMNCMNACNINSQCKAISMETTVGYFENICHHYNSIETNNKQNGEKKMAYKSIDCFVKNKTPWLNNNADLLVLYYPDNICSKLTTTTADDGNECELKIWHVEYDVKIQKGIEFDQSVSLEMENMQSCLNDCSHRQGCMTVAIDFNEQKCLFYNENGLAKSSGQPNWILFTIKCCVEFTI